MRVPTLNTDAAAWVVIPVLFLAVALKCQAQDLSGVPRISTAPAIESSPTAEAPVQVVTVIHRLTGLKVFRVLRRSPSPVRVVTPLDTEFLPDLAVHTSISAGLALGDGRTIGTYLPQSEAEVEMPMVWQPSALSIMEQVDTPSRSTARADKKFSERPSRGGSSDLTIMRGDGSRSGAVYIGLDEITGLSFLKAGGSVVDLSLDASDESLRIGQRIHLFAPEQASSGQYNMSPAVVVRLGKIEARLTRVSHSFSGEITRFTVSAPRLSREVVGGVAVNDKGQTVGIITACNDGEARVLSSATVRRAARRVQLRKTFFPRPLLGIQGQALASLSSTRLVSQWWNPVQASDLLRGREGILLTAVLPGTPAALAHLRPGDIITRVNDEIVKNGDDLSGFLAEAAAERSVSLTILRGELNRLAHPLPLPSVNPPMPPTVPMAPPPAIPAKPADPADRAVAPSPFSIVVDLSEAHVRTAYAPSILMDEEPFVKALESRGVEALSLSRGTQARVRARGAVLVLFVQPGSEASRGGLEPGDIIESINGHFISTAIQPESPMDLDGIDLSLAVIRQGTRRSIKLSSAHSHQR